MKSLQKRYIYAGILGAVSFIVFYLLFEAHILISILLTVLVYVGGIFLFKEKDVREYEPDTINKYYFQASKIQNYKDRINDEEVKQFAVQISETTSKIISALSQKPKKVTQVYNFFDYYMPLTVSLFEKYVYLEGKEDIKDNEKRFMDKVEIYLKNILEQFEKQLDNMYKTSELNMKNEIELFEKICDIDGLNKIEVGDKNDE